MTETVKPIRGEDTDFGVVYVLAADYARLEQECEDAKCQAELMQRAAEALREERDSALKQVDGLRVALINARNILDRNLPTLDRNIGFCPNIVEATVKEIERIDAALSAKP